MGPTRNLLNLLLYVNESCDLPMEGLFEVYGKRLMRSGHIQTLIGLVQRGVLSMCELDDDFLSKIADGVMQEWMEEEGADSKELEPLLELMLPKQQKKYEEILNLMDCFGICAIKYNPADFFTL